MTTSPADLDAIEARAKAATRGPWSVRENAHNHWGMREVIGSTIHCAAFTIASDVDYNKACQIDADAAFIAHARTDIPTLISALRARDAEIAQLNRLRLQDNDTYGKRLRQQAGRHDYNLHGLRAEREKFATLRADKDAEIERLRDSLERLRGMLCAIQPLLSDRVRHTVTAALAALADDKESVR